MFTRLFRLFGRPPAVEQEIDAEIAFHLNAVTQSLIANGMDREAAEKEARRRFGNLTQARRDLARLERGRRRKERRMRWHRDFVQDLAYAFRGVRRDPGFAAVIVLTLGLGIGANATMFGLLDRLLLKPPAHVEEPDRVVRMQLSESEPGVGGWTNESLAWQTYTDQRDRASWFSDIAAYFTHAAMPLGRGPEATNVRAVLATPSYYRVLGVRPALGRFYDDSEDRPDAGAAVAVVSWHYWQGALGGRTDVLGQTLPLGTRTYQIIGVAPRGFNGVDLNAVDLWVPFHSGAVDVMGGGGGWRTTYNWQWLRVIGRLRDGLTRAAASDQAQRIQRAAVAQVPNVDHEARTGLVPLRGFERAAVSHARERVALWLASVALVVLLIVSANVANLLLARAARRRREIAVRLALGVGRARLARQMLTESALLALGGGLAGLLIARWGGDLMRATLLPDVRWVDGLLDWRVAAATGVVTVLTGVLTGLAPALRAGTAQLTAALKGGTASGSSRSRLRGALVALQAGLSVLLLVGAGLFVKSLWRVVHTDIGYRPDRVLVADADLRLAGYDELAAIPIYDRILQRAAALPGVRNASLAINSPFWTMHGTRFRLTDRDSTPRHPRGGPNYNGVGPSFFATLGMRVVRGRGILETDRAGTQPVMVVNQHLAEFYWPGQDAIGKCVSVAADSMPCVTVVGVIANARNEAIQEEPKPMYYVPLDQSVRRGLSRDRMLFLQSDGDPVSLIAPVRRLFHELVVNLPAPNIRTFQSHIDPEIRPWRLGAVMFGVFGGLALLVAAIGMYSVLSYSVAQRSHEFGVRSALGASPRRIVGAVVRDGAGVLLGGILAGLLVALLIGRFLQPLLYQTSARDLGIFCFVVAVLLLAALGAMILPARRATRVDPLEALRTD